MAFFDNLSKKASEATAKAVQKAQDLSETAKLNSMISEEEKRIETTYYQIGKLYVSVHRNDSEEEFSGMVASIADAEGKISVYRKQIQDLKGMQRCEKCGAEVPKGVAFCSSCGAPMPRVEATVPEDSVRCEGCGAYVKAGMRFCTSCGRPIPQPTAPAGTPECNGGNDGQSQIIQTETMQTAEVQEAVSDPPLQTEVAQEPQNRVCPNCGAKLDEGQSFCTECGTRM